MKNQFNWKLLGLAGMMMLWPLLGAAQVNLDSGLVAYYPFSGNADDESGNGNDGVLTGGATASDTLQIGDNDSSVVVLPNSVLDSLTDFSIALQVKFDTFHVGSNLHNNTIISGVSLNDDNHFVVLYNKQSSWFAIFIDGISYRFTNIELQAAQWYSFVFTREADTLHFLPDSILNDTSILGSGLQLNVAQGGLVIGQEQDVVGGGFSSIQSMAGKLDNLRFYNRALNRDEAIEYHNNPTNIPTSVRHNPVNLIAYLYPNPAPGGFTLRSPQAAIQSLTLYDLTGRRLPAEISHDRHEAQVRSSYRGLVIVKVQTDRGMWVQKVRME